MPRNEVSFDFFIRDLAHEAGIELVPQGSNIHEIDQALKTASKNQTGNVGYPEFVGQVGDFILVMEDKANRANLVLEEEGEISQKVQATRNYALNGALFYANKIVKKTSFKKVFAFGNAGDKRHHIIRPLFVDETGYKVLPDVDTFENFSESNIGEYYNRMVLGKIPPEEVELAEILKKAKELHEYLRNYGGLRDSEKPLVVSAILLALREKKYGFQLDQLIGDQVYTDGDRLFEQIKNHLRRARVAPEVKKERVLNQFTLIKNRPVLNTLREDMEPEEDSLGKTPLKFFAEYIDNNIFKAFVANSSEDYLGRFYGEFVSYSGGDSQSLGVVLTPRHITELFCDLVDLKPDDVLFDPCCGTGGFLVSGMHRMIQLANDTNAVKDIKKKQIHGIEIRDDMFSIATTNMILRGDGQSNLICDNFMAQDPSQIQLKGITVGMMNPPYSQAKDKSTANLSELSFTRHLLNSVLVGGRVAVIVPVSAMIGKTNEDQAIKEDILKNHTLEGVINLNKNTFYGVGTVPCIAVFTAGEPHPAEKRVKFINFEDDGFVVKMHIGLVETERAKDRKQYLLDCWRGRLTDCPSSFMVESTIKATDEWLHSFYYYNDEIPTEQDFINAVADYLTFEFNMISHGRGYLFKEEKPKQGKNRSIRNLTRSFQAIEPLEQKEWGEFPISKIFTISPGKRLTKANMVSGNKPFIGATDSNNGITEFVSNTNSSEDCDVLGVNYNGSVVENFYHPYTCIFSDDVKRLKLKETTGCKYVYLFMKIVILQQKRKYTYGYKFNEKRMDRQILMLPVKDDKKEDYAYMEQYVKNLFIKLKLQYLKEKAFEF